jgi:hypothetical protein
MIPVHMIELLLKRETAGGLQLPAVDYRGSSDTQHGLPLWKEQEPIIPRLLPPSVAAPGFHAAFAQQGGTLSSCRECLEGLRDVLLLRYGQHTEREQHVVLQLTR